MRACVFDELLNIQNCVFSSITKRIKIAGIADDESGIGSIENTSVSLLLSANLRVIFVSARTNKRHHHQKSILAAVGITQASLLPDDDDAF